jgi:Cu+-exporting ATPase
VSFLAATVYFCCGGCLAKAQKEPALYIKATAAEQAKAAQASSEFLGKGDGIETCPVTGEPVNKTLKAEVNGRTFYVCCEGCIETVKKSPDLYLKPEKKAPAHDDHAAGNSGAGAFLGKGDGVTTCPVTGEPISKDVKVEIAGRTVYACCAGCLATIAKNPELYLKKN